jgi:hypothetical protein
VWGADGQARYDGEAKLNHERSQAGTRKSRAYSEKRTPEGRPVPSKGRIASGVRYRSAAGATIVTAPGNAEDLRRNTAAPMSWLMLEHIQTPPTTSHRVEMIDGDRRVFSDGSRRLEIHRISSAPRAGRMFAGGPREAPGGRF